MAGLVHDVVDGDGAGVGRGAVAVPGGVESRNKFQPTVVKTANLRQNPEEQEKNNPSSEQW